MVDGVVFDNFLLTSDQSIAKQYADQIWYPKSVLEGKAISAASESVVDAIVNATKDRPWLWAVYLVAILLPLVILIVFCWTRKSSKKPVESIRKKTDESTPDSPSQRLASRKNDEDEDEDEEPEEIEIKQRVTTVTSKDALENEDEEEEEEQEENDEESKVRIPVRSKHSLENCLSFFAETGGGDFQSKGSVLAGQQSSSSFTQRIIQNNCLRVGLPLSLSDTQQTRWSIGVSSSSSLMNYSICLYFFFSLFQSVDVSSLFCTLSYYAFSSLYTPFVFCY